jgi:epoxyqueuosine reductase
MEELVQFLRERDAVVVGFADLTDLPADVRAGMPVGVSFAVSLTPSIAAAMPDGPSQAYSDEYDSKNAHLSRVAEEAAEFLRQRGHSAEPLASTGVGVNPDTLSTRLPHKTVATKAGLGWVGKCALLITEGYGAAIRFCSVLTDADLPLAEPITESRCGQCTECMKVCPGGAVKGPNWYAGIPRDEIFDAFACRDAQGRRRAAAGIAKTGCGLCIVACPYTKRYLSMMGY